ncbi:MULTISPECIES: L-threonylcarbamoyladenylate synthase [unclassified Paludibacterium]|uniref:L-threonylcarbamoyladenylate synthase n=1 Tax=unclassified Paludibacterium TaxID=2618429 RepID=UPI001C0522AF|nr:L-threonylcarbamoyladenylate synthase [Paludibacterium sp. B53371]BEV73420.1 L-threonylcarbamoyladenylate synthase [Paludibacterium sp. THUN1379]
MNPTVTTDIDQACARLRVGQLVAIPTETVYGLAADACNLDAVQKVFRLKRRPASNPLIVHLAEAAQSVNWVKDVPPAAEKLMKTFWPGPLTLVLPAADHVSRVITAGQGSVALRVPAHPQARELLHRFGGGLVAPSANRYMSISPTSAAHVARQFAGEDLLILDGGACKVGLESTIVGLLPGEPPRLLRHGMLSAAELEAVLGCKLEVGAKGGLRVPGQHHRHYAPHTPAWRFSEVPAEALADAGCAWLWCGGAQASAGPALDLGDDPKAYARALYDALYQLDHLEGISRLLIQTPPDTPAWAAVHDRLHRASQPV